MDSQLNQTQWQPPTPVSPMLDYSPCSPVGRRDFQSQSCDDGRVIQHHQLACRGDEMIGFRHSGDDLKFELALANMMKDRERFTAAESIHQQRNATPPTKKVIRKPSATTKRVSRDVSKNQATKSQRPPSLAATHPSLYSKQQTCTPRKMLPTPPPVDYPVEKDLIQRKPEKPTVTTPSLPPWRCYTDPTYQLSCEPGYDDPKFRMLKVDLQPNQPNVLSPTFMIGLPCGGMIEGANCYPETKISQARDARRA